tara:strand:+ start:152 stop:601 length:450 start_codon:yes stop_codon:yes gene_type:complete
MHFVHEIIRNPVDGDMEIVKLNETEIPIAEFIEMEPTYSALPVGVQGINYIPNGEHYSFDLNGSVIPAHISTEVLDKLLAKLEIYQTTMADKVAKAEAEAQTDAEKIQVEIERLEYQLTRRRVREMTTDAGKQWVIELDKLIAVQRSKL